MLLINSVTALVAAVGDFGTAVGVLGARAGALGALAGALGATVKVFGALVLVAGLGALLKHILDTKSQFWSSPQSADVQHWNLGTKELFKKNSANMLYGVGNVSSVARRMIEDNIGISKYPVYPGLLDADLGRLIVIDSKVFRDVVKFQAVSSTKILGSKFPNHNADVMLPGRRPGLVDMTVKVNEMASVPLQILGASGMVHEKVGSSVSVLVSE
jgi:hypothetical protein